MAIAHGHDAVVLGAFGCGAFRNPAAHMAQLFKEVRVRVCGARCACVWREGALQECVWGDGVLWGDGALQECVCGGEAAWCRCVWLYLHAIDS